MKTFMFTLAALASSTISASAADIYDAGKPQTAVTRYSNPRWDGLYVGGGLGAGFDRHRVTNETKSHPGVDGSPASCGIGTVNEAGNGCIAPEFTPATEAQAAHCPTGYHPHHDHCDKDKGIGKAELIPATDGTPAACSHGGTLNEAGNGCGAPVFVPGVEGVPATLSSIARDASTSGDLAWDVRAGYDIQLGARLIVGLYGYYEGSGAEYSRAGVAISNNGAYAGGARIGGIACDGICMFYAGAAYKTVSFDSNIGGSFDVHGVETVLGVEFKPFVQSMPDLTVGPEWTHFFGGKADVHEDDGHKVTDDFDQDTIKGVARIRF